MQPSNNSDPLQKSNISNSISSKANSPTKTKHSNLPLALIVLGVVETIITALYLLKISQIYQKLDVRLTNTLYIAIIFLLLLTALAILQTIYGFKLKKINKVLGMLPPEHRKFAILILAALPTIMLLSISILFILFNRL
ncbi:hypothetical protein A3A60_04020 [Candidatus Curtissbacteria bacterium RIFCSPLOWO2_01_FULL_42_26]|uniref:Uncharacterized protein n=1 Tax=Candidatus Curtissbacteria bacterium RIFCSPLOWO2_01_FULL_42_26 TaxID=1797729 RepID=A0A1F5HYN0_9BACT|nr:MAG: hypothetical protein A3A60_04020 [Candidatus Curtissbacteria bacterium RIFCSPLOWO2_01_FULL_42_26]